MKCDQEGPSMFPYYLSDLQQKMTEIGDRMLQLNVKVTAMDMKGASLGTVQAQVRTTVFNSTISILECCLLVTLFIYYIVISIK